MEHICCTLEKVLSIIDSFEDECTKSLQDSLTELDELCRVPVSSLKNKKAKRLEPITDVEPENDSLVSTDKSCDTRSTIATESMLENSQQGRPIRTARLKISDLKEKRLNSKLRRPSNSDNNSTQSIITVKQEKLSVVNDNKGKSQQVTKTKILEQDFKEGGGKRKSDESDKENSKKIDSSVEIVAGNDTASTVDLLSDDDVDKMPPPTILPPKKRNNRKNKGSKDNSTPIVVNKSLKAEKLSLDDSNKKSMSPLNGLQEVRVKLERIRVNSQNFAPEKSEGGRKHFKHKPLKMEDDGTVSDAEKEDRVTSVADDRKANESTGVRKSERNAKKNKQGSADSVYEDAVEDQINNNRKSRENNVINKKKSLVKDGKSKLPMITPDEINEVAVTSPEKPIDATFVSAISEVIDNDDNANDAENLAKADATFVTAAVNSAQQTFVVDKKSNKGTKESPNIPQDGVTKAAQANTEVANSDCSDATFCVNTNEADAVLSSAKAKNNGNAVEISQNSLLTEDESQEDEEDRIVLSKLITKAKPKLKHKNELFSPFIQSPVRKKVEAFEKHASVAIAPSPIPQRQTRTKTRLKQQQQADKEKESVALTTAAATTSTVTTTESSNQKTTTPLIPSRFARILTPTQQSNITPSLANPYKKVHPSSTSKLQTLQKTISLTSIASSKGSSMSQEMGIEKSQSKTKLNQLVEEKKKLREMKTQMVLKTKEARDKERQERIMKALEDKEEKARKIEAEKRKHFEEVQRNIKQFEEAQRRIEKQKQLEYEKSEIARKEREMQERIFKNKEQMKMKYQQNQLLIQQQLQQQSQKKNNMTPLQHKVIEKFQYDFEMLNSDDSTDDEGKTSTKRPQPPLWSKSSVRQFYIERQSFIPAKIIDSFFSVEPTTPDLAQIFPSIDPRYLKRNSSVVWKTPPRYSELPKY